MPASKPTRQNVRKPSAFEQAVEELRKSPRSYEQVSARWLLGAAGVVLGAAVMCGWLTLCFLFWLGSWQLLYHPKAEITRTPASVGLAFEPVKFAATETGTTRLTGWWIPNPSATQTVLYLHGADGNLGDTVDTLAALHREKLNVFAFDYRGYGQSQMMREAGRPSEKQLRQDAEWALTWLTLTRHLPAKSIVIAGSGLGANVAAELAADHEETAGVVLDQPLQNALGPVFADSRSRLVPARWLVSDGYDLTATTRPLKIPSLWLILQVPAAYGAVSSPKTAVTLKGPMMTDPNFGPALRRWLDDLR